MLQNINFSSYIVTLYYDEGLYDAKNAELGTSGSTITKYNQRVVTMKVGCKNI